MRFYAVALGREQNRAFDGARMAAEFGDHRAVLARDRDVVDAGAAGALRARRLRAISAVAELARAR